MKLDPDRFHTVTVSRIGANQEVFLDYFRLRGVTEVHLEMRVGEPPKATIELIVSEVSWVEPEKEGS